MLRVLKAEEAKLLATVLSPEEVAEFKARTSPVADTLRMETRYFNLTADEFQL